MIGVKNLSWYFGSQGLPNFPANPNLIKGLQEKIEKLEKELEDLKKRIQSEDVKYISEINEFQIGEHLITEKTGWVIDSGQIQCGEDTLLYEKMLPFSTLRIKKPK